MCLLIIPLLYHIWCIWTSPFWELCYPLPAFLPEPVNMMTRQSQVIINTPQLPTRRAQTGLNTTTYRLRRGSFQPGATTPNAAQHIPIPVATFVPPTHS